eukprot:scaffold98960_cov22-Tisochrysis_lutea.AAC.5
MALTKRLKPHISNEVGAPAHLGSLALQPISWSAGQRLGHAYACPLSSERAVRFASAEARCCKWWVRACALQFGTQRRTCSGKKLGSVRLDRQSLTRSVTLCHCFLRYGEMELMERVKVLLQAHKIVFETGVSNDRSSGHQLCDSNCRAGHSGGSPSALAQSHF